MINDYGQKIHEDCAMLPVMIEAFDTYPLVISLTGSSSSHFRKWQFRCHSRIKEGRLGLGGGDEEDEGKLRKGEREEGTTSKKEANETWENHFACVRHANSLKILVAEFTHICVYITECANLHPLSVH